MTDRDRTQRLNIEQLQTLLLTGQAMNQERDQDRICLWATDAASSILASPLAAIALNTPHDDDRHAVYGRLRDSPLSEPLAISLSRLTEVEWSTPQASGQADCQRLRKRRDDR